MTEVDVRAIVVSEETGKISVAVGGKLQHGITLEELELVISDTLNERRTG